MSGPENCFFILVLGRQPDMGLNWLWLERKLERRIQKQMTLGEVLCFVWILLSTAKGRVVFSPLASARGARKTIGNWERAAGERW